MLLLRTLLHHRHHHRHHHCHHVSSALRSQSICSHNMHAWKCNLIWILMVCANSTCWIRTISVRVHYSVLRTYPVPNCLGHMLIPMQGSFVTKLVCGVPPPAPQALLLLYGLVHETMWDFEIVRIRYLIRFEVAGTHRFYFHMLMHSN